MPLVSDEPREFEHSALRESVWTGMFANTFFDAQGNQVLPPVTHDNGARRAGQILLLLGLVPTALVLAGLGSTILALLRRDADECDVVMLACFATSIALFVVGAKSVPMHAAIKATYLLHASVMFAYWFAAGLALFDGRLRGLVPLVLAECGLLAVVSVAVFSQGVFFWRDYIANNERVPVWNNLEGVAAYAAGNRGEARRRFEYAASANLYLAEENLAVLALEDGETLESLYRMRLAARLQPTQSIGWRQDRVRFDRETQAEYGNSIGAAYYELGRVDDAAAELERAMDLDETIPETSFDLGIVELERALSAGDGAARRRLELSAARRFKAAYALDPGFTEAGALAAEFDGEEGTCRDFTQRPRPRSWTPRRAYPLETMTGNMHASGLQRRRHITRLSPRLQAELQNRGCL
jgi:tetratricopeptide (TPR) repeat protein